MNLWLLPEAVAVPAPLVAMVVVTRYTVGAQRMDMVNRMNGGIT